jgi:hypothetical protein
MDKLKLLPLHLNELPLQRVGTNAFLPGPNQTAIAFGWASTAGDPLAPNRHWYCEFGPDGATPHWLPDSLGSHHAELVGWTASTSSCNKSIQAFRCGDAVGLLLGLHELQLLDPQSGSLRPITIEGFAPDAPWVPLRVGHGDAQQFPVILAGPLGGYFDGHQLALLTVDSSAGTARWDLTDGQPSRLPDTDYVPLLADRSSWTPLIYSAARRGQDWLFYVGPTHTSHQRGMAPSALGLHGSDLRLQRVIHQAGEASFGDISSCGEWLILSPYAKSGPRKGRQTLVNLNDGRVLEPAPPRGHAGWQVIDHQDGCWWLLPMGLRYGANRVLACAAK